LRYIHDTVITGEQALTDEGYGEEDDAGYLELVKFYFRAEPHQHHERNEGASKEHI
jgi:hypothetical protein